MTQPVARHCPVCELEHEPAALRLVTNCTVALKAEVRWLRGVLDHVRATDRMNAAYEFEQDSLAMPTPLNNQETK